MYNYVQYVARETSGPNNLTRTSVHVSLQHEFVGVGDRRTRSALCRALYMGDQGEGLRDKSQSDITGANSFPLPRRACQKANGVKIV